MSLTEFNEEEFIRNRRAEGREEGRAEGREEGRIEKAIETARNFLANNISPDLIASCTGLPLEQVIALQ